MMHRRECVRVRVPLLPGGRAVSVPTGSRRMDIDCLAVSARGPHARLPRWLCCTPYFHRFWVPTATIPRQESLGRNAQLAWGGGGKWEKACEDAARLTSTVMDAFDDCTLFSAGFGEEGSRTKLRLYM